jgi:hypothetical protein
MDFLINSSVLVIGVLLGRKIFLRMRYCYTQRVHSRALNRRRKQHINSYQKG